MDKIVNIIWSGIANELEAFFQGLNWTYIIMLVLILYGIAYKKEFGWYNRFFEKRKNLEEYKEWIAGILVGIVFGVFRSLGPNGIDSEYISQLLRSWFLVIIFASVFIDGVVRLLKFIGNKIDDKDKKVS